MGNHGGFGNNEKDKQLSQGWGRGDSGGARRKGKGLPGKGSFDDAQRDGQIRAEYHGLF